MLMVSFLCFPSPYIFVSLHPTFLFPFTLHFCFPSPYIFVSLHPAFLFSFTLHFCFPSPCIFVSLRPPPPHIPGCWGRQEGRQQGQGHLFAALRWSGHRHQEWSGLWLAARPHEGWAQKWVANNLFFDLKAMASRVVESESVESHVFSWSRVYKTAGVGVGIIKNLPTPQPWLQGNPPIKKGNHWLDNYSVSCSYLFCRKWRGVAKQSRIKASKGPNFYEQMLVRCCIYNNLLLNLYFYHFLEYILAQKEREQCYQSISLNMHPCNPGMHIVIDS